MSLEAVNLVFDIKSIAPLHKFVLVVLGDVTYDDFLVKVNPEYISRITCIPENEVKNILNSLVRDGYLLRTAETHPCYPEIPLWKLNCDVSRGIDEF